MKVPCNSPYCSDCETRVVTKEQIEKAIQQCRQDLLISTEFNTGMKNFLNLIELIVNKLEKQNEQK